MSKWKIFSSLLYIIVSAVLPGYLIYKQYQGQATDEMCFAVIVTWWYLRSVDKECDMEDKIRELKNRLFRLEQSSSRK